MKEAHGDIRAKHSKVSGVKNVLILFCFSEVNDHNNKKFELKSCDTINYLVRPTK